MWLGFFLDRKPMQYKNQDGISLELGNGFSSHIAFAVFERMCLLSNKRIPLNMALPKLYCVCFLCTMRTYSQCPLQEAPQFSREPPFQSTHKDTIVNLPSLELLQKKVSLEPQANKA